MHHQSKLHIEFYWTKKIIDIFNQIFLSKFSKIKCLITFKHTKETEILGLMHLELKEL